VDLLFAKEVGGRHHTQHTPTLVLTLLPPLPWLSYLPRTTHIICSSNSHMVNPENAAQDLENGKQKSIKGEGVRESVCVSVERGLPRDTLLNGPFSFISAGHVDEERSWVS